MFPPPSPLSSRKRLSFLKKISPEFAKAHFEVARGSPESNRAYCTKSDTRVDGPWEFGALPFGQGHRVDLDDAAEAVLATGNLNSVAPGLRAKYGSGLAKLAASAPAPRRDNITVI